MAAIYFFIWAAFVWDCCTNLVLATSNGCPSACSCLGDYVDCSRLGLIEVPKDLPTWITDLEIQSNGISSIHPDDFKGLINLQKIDLSNNEITFINESVFANLPALKDIKINFNKLTEIPIFKQNPFLHRLELTHNDIHTINPSALKYLKQLDLLDLSYNVLREVTNSSFPENLTLTKLFLKNNELSLFEVGGFYNLTKLESLKMSKNKIQILPKDLFARSGSLKMLDLSKNKLVRLAGLTFQGLHGLQRLKLHRNEMHLLEDGVFYGLSKLQSLQLDENNLTTISQNWLYGLDNLKELVVSNNQIFRIEPKSWEYAPHITTLDLHRNELVTVESDSLSNLESLHSLNLASNHIEFIQEEAFKHLAELEQLDLNNNRISSTIEDLKGVFTGLVSLKILSLENNRIKTITKQAFMGLDQLEQLLLNSNNITTIQGNAFEPLPLLRQLSFNTTSLFCDCQLSWVPIWLRDNNFERSVIAKCGHPQHLNGRSIFTVDSSEYKCDGQFLKPEIVSNPRSQDVIKGANITLNCSAASTESKGSPTQFQWKKDNIILTDAKTEDTAQRSGNLTHYVSKLHIFDAKDTDAGRYQCTEAVLVCAAEGQPKPIISWQKDGGFDHFPAAQERRMQVIPEDDHFFIVNVKAADEGIYSCIAKNDAGTIMANVTLTVLQTPSFVRPMEEKETREGETSVMECLAQGSPQPTLTWYHKGQPLVPSQRHFFTAENQLLIIVETKTSDAGEYTCEMSNTLGTIRGTSTLTVVTGSVMTGEAKGKGNSGGGGGLDDESTTTGIIIIAVVCCVVGTSLVWVIIIYKTRKRQEFYSATPTDETTLPGEVPSSGYMSSEKEGSYTHGVPITNGTLPYQYHELAMKESGYESSSGRFRAARPAIFPSDVNGENGSQGYDLMRTDGHYVEQSDENSLSSQEYPRSETDSIKSDENSVDTSHSSQQQILSTFHPIAASRDRIARSRSCSTSQIPREYPQDYEPFQRENSHQYYQQKDCGHSDPSKTNPDNSVGSQTENCEESGSPLNSPAVNNNNSKYNSLCRNCGDSNSPNHVKTCKHNKNPPIPPKPSRFRHGRHKETSHFDRAQPPGISRSSSHIPDYMYGTEDIPQTPPRSLVPEFHPPPPPPIGGCPGVYVAPEYEEGMYIHGYPGMSSGAFVPVYHPINTPQCDCHLRVTPPTSSLKAENGRTHLNPNKPNSVSKVQNQRTNGVIGCVHHRMNGYAGVTSPSWQGHSYTLPYMPSGHHVPQVHPSQMKLSPQQKLQQQISPGRKQEHPKHRLHFSPKQEQNST
ncbi:LRIG3-like protein [Mya arenaria]|uniref:LRIG3-like protein n=1 Tax=Mya arenaria TaxID=6604 RepID=A0ABY7FVH8_MYAAR|nr:LRIG3-like protein [Mya arenaria]